MAHIGDFLRIAKLEVGTKGELIVTDGSTRQVLALSGNNGWVLTEDSTQDTGLKWAAPTGGGGGSGAAGALTHMGW